MIRFFLHSVQICSCGIVVQSAIWNKLILVLFFGRLSLVILLSKKSIWFGLIFNEVNGFLRVSLITFDIKVELIVHVGSFHNLRYGKGNWWETVWVEAPSNCFDCRPVWIVSSYKREFLGQEIRWVFECAKQVHVQVYLIIVGSSAQDGMNLIKFLLYLV